MSILRIELGPAPASGEQHGETLIEVSHVKACEVRPEDARHGLGHSPGMVLLMPRSASMCFKVGETLIPAPPNMAMLFDGNAPNILVSVERNYDEWSSYDSLRLIEISATINGTSRLKEFLSLPAMVDRQSSDALAAICQDLLSKQQTMQLLQTDDVSLHLAAARIVNLIMSSAEGQSKSHGRAGKDGQLDKLKRYLLTNLSSRITTSDMAAHVGMSRQHFCEWVKPLLGETPARYLRRLRLERGLEWLEHSDESVDEIAEQTGFADRYHFSKRFKEQFGCSPVQYRKECKIVRRVDSYTQSRALFDQKDYAGALAACEQGLNPPDLSDQDRLRCLHGRCLAELGRHAEALDVWGSLAGASQALQAGLLRCQLHFRNDQTDLSLAELERLWSDSEGWQYNDIIELWIEQASVLYTLHRAHALRQYLAFRRDRFVYEQQSKAITIHSCRDLGDYLEVLTQCPDAKAPCIHSLRRAGEYDRAISQYGSEMPQAYLAKILLEAGRYDEVLSLRPGNAGCSCQALVELGRAEEAIERFPDYCASAYLALGQYEELLERVVGACSEKVFALYALGRSDELTDYEVRGSHFWHQAQLYVNPEAVLETEYPDTPLFVYNARLLAAIQALREGRSEDALEHLHEIPSVTFPDMWPQFHSSLSLLLASVMPALLVEATDLNSDLEAICRDFRYFDRQRLYYDAAYLLGRIDANAYQQQPCKMDLDERWGFIQPLAHDLAGEAKAARKGYEQCLGKIPLHGNLIVRRFCEWRLGR